MTNATAQASPNITFAKCEVTEVDFCSKVFVDQDKTSNTRSPNGHFSTFITAQDCIGKTTLHQMSRIIAGMLAMTGWVTMLGISRWTGAGGSYRTIQR
jgi:hypothetical protein